MMNYTESKQILGLLVIMLINFEKLICSLSLHFFETLEYLNFGKSIKKLDRSFFLQQYN